MLPTQTRAITTTPLPRPACALLRLRAEAMRIRNGGHATCLEIRDTGHGAYGLPLRQHLGPPGTRRQRPLHRRVLIPAGLWHQNYDALTKPKLQN